MKALSIGIVGNIDCVKDFSQEINQSFGHHVSVLENNEENNFDVIFYFNKSPLEIASQCSNFNKPLRLCLGSIDSKISIILFKDQSTVYEVISIENPSNKDLLNSLVDSVIFIARGEFTDFNIFPVNRVLEFLGNETENFHSNYVNHFSAIEQPWKYSVSTLFEKQAGTTPNEVAIGYGGESLTYRELNNCANYLAGYLSEKYREKYGCSMPQDSLIALYVDPGFEMIIAMLAVMKVQSAYIPIAPEHPQSRISKILQDADPKFVLTQGVYRSRLNNWLSIKNGKSFDLVEIDCALSEKNKDRRNPEKKGSPEDLIYVIYTSGSTGIPNGVCVEHRNVVNICHHMIEKRAFSGKPIYCQFINYIFDASVLEIFPPLLSGGKLSIIPQVSRKNTDDLIDYINYYKITHLCLPTAFFQNIEEKIADLPIQCLTIGGDEISHIHIRPKYKIFNQYGLTECGVCSTEYEIGLEGTVNIGKPIKNTKTFVLDEEMKPTTSGEVGNLFIAGNGVSRGYLAKDDLTNARFLKIPDAIKNQIKGFSTIFKTNDLVRVLEDGNLDFIGRKDHEIKLRGHRINPGEIDHLLEEISEVKDSYTTTIDDHGVKRMVSCVVTTKNSLRRNQYEESRMALWPIVSDYGVYDDYIYSILSENHFRDQLQREALRNVVKDKIVLDVGTGSDAYLALMAAELGAAKVYAVEIDANAVEVAHTVVEASPYSNIIEVIQGDITTLPSPEKVDLCLSQMVGTIGTSEGIVPVLQYVKENWLKNDGIIIPDKCYTYVSMAQLPDYIIKDAQVNSTFKKYAQLIFEKVGQVFDLRVGLTNFDKSTLLSNASIVESIQFNKNADLTNINTNQVQLQVEKNGFFNALVVWVVISLDDVRQLDSMDQNLFSVPVIIPIDKPLFVQKSNRILLKFKSIEAEKFSTDYFFDYEISGHTGSASSLHISKGVCSKKFYEVLHRNLTKNTSYEQDKLKNHLKKSLPEYMIPHRIVIAETIPVTMHGKKDERKIKKFLSEQIRKNNFINEPRNPYETFIHQTWCDALSIASIDIFDNFFDIGGDSLSAAIVTEVINKSTIDNCDHSNLSKLQCTIKDLYDHPSIASFSEYLKGSLWAESGSSQKSRKQIFRELAHQTDHTFDTSSSIFNDFEDFVPFEEFLKGSDDSDMVFMFPPQRGGGESYFSNIIPEISKLNIISFNNFYKYLIFNNCSEKTSQLLQNVSLEWLASQYLPYLENKQTTGVYRLFGWSFGGLLAFEVARQLVESKGYRCNLVLIDPNFQIAEVFKEIGLDLAKAHLEQFILNYDLSDNQAKIDGKITLFKPKVMDDFKNDPIAQKMTATELKELQSIRSYYIEKTSDNNLNKVVICDDVKIVHLHSTHTDWIKSERDLKNIAHAIVE